MADRLANIPGVEAVALGGSRALGTERDDSDWDFGLYYRGSIDPADVRALGFEGEVTAPGAWAYPMNGGAWLTVDGTRVDLLYRDLNDVARWTRAAERGEWELFRMPGYLAGFPSYTLAAELAVGVPLVGSLPRPSFPSALRDVAPGRWRSEAEFAIARAADHASRDDAAACVGKLAFAALAEAHARASEAGSWVINEKGLVRRCGLESVDAALRTPRPTHDLVLLVERIREELRVR
jgi:hypothetical protein